MVGGARGELEVVSARTILNLGLKIIHVIDIAITNTNEHVKTDAPAPLNKRSQAAQWSESVLEALCNLGPFRSQVSECIVLTAPKTTTAIRQIMADIFLYCS